MNAWVLVLFSWPVTAPANVAIDPIAYFRSQQACEAVALRATVRPVPVGEGKRYQCVFNGV